MTDFENLKQQIEQYVRTGMAEAKRQQLVAMAGKIGINPGQLVMLIKNAELELKFATGISNNEYPESLGSGFMTDGQESGFIGNDSEATMAEVDKPTSAIAQHDTTTANKDGLLHSSDFSEIKKLESTGAMSDVYSAIHLGRRKVIIKRIKPQYRYNKDYIDLFYKEFDTGYSLENTNIVHFYGKGEDAEGPYYFMEYVDGRTLYDFIHVEKNPDVGIITKIVLQLLDALKYMHQKQVFHRDLKPQNIMLTYKGNNVKIIDFGLAAADSIVDRLSKAGTPKYAAPELMSRATTADQRSDIYSLGIIIIELFTAVADRTALPKIPDELFKTIADKATMAQPIDRYQSCDEIIRLLLSSGNSANPIPTWLEEKIKDYASDGVITRNERAVLDREIAKAGVDKDLAEAIIADEVEKAISRKRKEELQRRKEFGNIPNSSRQRNGMKKLFQVLVGIIVLLLVALLVIQLQKNNFSFSFDSNTNTTEQKGAESFSKGEIVYTTASVNLMKLASSDSKVLKVVPKGKAVEIIDVGYFWQEVKVDNTRGYMPGVYLSHQIK
jgi:serine/threonine protein kinase